MRPCSMKERSGTVMAWKIGDEFNEFRGAYVPAKRGEGTHIWNGSKIVPKSKKRKEKKNDERNGN